MGLIATCSISNQNRLYLWRRYEYRFWFLLKVNGY
jgi:hypothetical protein